MHVWYNYIEFKSKYTQKITKNKKVTPYRPQVHSKNLVSSNIFRLCDVPWLNENKNKFLIEIFKQYRLLCKYLQRIRITYCQSLSRRYINRCSYFQYSINTILKMGCIWDTIMGHHCSHTKNPPEGKFFSKLKGIYFQNSANLCATKCIYFAHSVLSFLY